MTYEERQELYRLQRKWAKMRANAKEILACIDLEMKERADRILAEPLSAQKRKRK